MEYVLFIHNNVDSPTSEDQWDKFFAAANENVYLKALEERGSKLLTN